MLVAVSYTTMSERVSERERRKKVRVFISIYNIAVLLMLFSIHKELHIFDIVTILRNSNALMIRGKIP